MKKALCAALVLSMTLALAGCAEGGQTDTATETETTENSVAEETAEGEAAEAEDSTAEEDAAAEEAAENTDEAKETPAAE